MSPDTTPRSVGVVLVWLAFVLVFVAVAAPRLDAPGLYYDEAFLAQQARDFLAPEREVHHPASTRQVELLGRPLPLRNAVYLGSLKSQLLIPCFGLFGDSVATLRLATAALGLLALLFAMLWAHRILGFAPACLGGLLVFADPTVWFLSLYEWGPFTTLYLCRASGLYLVSVGAAARSSRLVAAGGLVLGLGIFGRADFVLFPVAAVLALAIVRRGTLLDAWRSYRRFAVVLGLSVALGASPMLLSLGDLLETTSHPALLRRGDLIEKLRVLWSLADGSHFYRLIEAGGRFDQMFGLPAPWTAFAWLQLACVAVAFGRMLWRLVTHAALGAAEFLLLTGCLVTVGTLALPGAVRAHHLMSVLPFFHLLVASLAVELWRWIPPVRRGAGLARATVVVVLGVVLVGDARAIGSTYDLIEKTGGRGRWTQAIGVPAHDLDSDPARRRGVSLDWGFHEPLLFLTERARLLEPIWGIREAVREQGEWRFAGEAGDLYLVHDGEYDLFGFGPAFLAAARRLAEREPGTAEVRAHSDRDGRVAFWTVRVDRRHELVYRRRFRFELSGSEDTVGTR
jgi:hypothetical protein